MACLHPPALAPSSRVAVTCPASPADPERLERGIARLRGLGWEVVVGATCAARDGIWAGDDGARAQELRGFLLDPSIHAIFAARGGVGCMRLLPHLDDLAEGPAPRWIIGRSDITALHLRFWDRFGWVGISGTMVATDLGGEDPGYAWQQTMRLLCDPEPLGRITEEPLDVWIAGRAEGALIPANLSVLTSMVGTPYAPPLHGTILVLEEIDEPPQRIDRMLTQLRFAGALDGLAGLVLGQFTACTPRETSLPPDAAIAVLRDHAKRIGVPTLAGLPYGHETRFAPLPIGVQARLQADPPGLVLLEGAAARRDKGE